MEHVVIKKTRAARRENPSGSREIADSTTLYDSDRIRRDEIGAERRASTDIRRQQQVDAFGIQHTVIDDVFH